MFDNTQVDQWLDWEFIELEPAALTFTLPYLGLFPYLKDVHSNAEEDLSNTLEFLDKCLKGKKFIVGNETTIADISIASSLNVCFQWIFDEKYREKIPNVVNWYENVINEEYWRKEYGKPILCKLPLKFPG